MLFVANTDWYLYNFRLPLALALRARGFKVVMVSPLGDYVSLMQDAGVEWRQWDLPRQGINPFFEMHALIKLYRLFVLEKPDLLQHFTIKCVIYGSIAARMAGINSVVNSIPGLGYMFTSSDIKARILAPLVKRLYRISLQNTQVIFQNPDDIVDFSRLGLVSETQSHLIMGSGVNMAKFSPVVKRDDKIRFLFASRLLHSKGVLEFIEAAGVLKRLRDNVEFLVAGSSDLGNPDAISLSVIKGWVGNDNIDYLGHVADMKGLLDKVDVMVLPTTYREGVPRILIEASACGLPIITTDYPGCREVVKHNLNGILLQSVKVESLVEKMMMLIDDVGCRKRMGKESRRLAVELFSEEKVISKTLEIYEKSFN